MATRKDQDDIDNYWEMSAIIRDTNLTTQSAVDDAATFHLANRKVVGRSGTVVSNGLPGLLPGYKVMIFDPNNKMNGYFVMSEIRHSLTKDFMSTVTVHEQISRDVRITGLLKNIVDQEQQSLDIENENDLENSFNVTFDDSTQIDSNLSSSNVDVVNGRLVLTSGSTGDAITVTETAQANVTSFIMNINGSDYENSSFYVSVNGGSTWEDVTLRSLLTVSGTGKRIRYKITLNKTTKRPNPSIESIGGLYK